MVGIDDVFQSTFTRHESHINLVLHCTCQGFPTSFKYQNIGLQLQIQRLMLLFDFILNENKNYYFMFVLFFSAL